MSPPEARMWNLLRMDRFWPFHFRRQVPLGRYYADFASHGARLVIEIEGTTHTTDAAMAYDARRTAFIETQGYRVLRFTTTDVLNDIGGVAELVLAACGVGPAQAAVPHPPATFGGSGATHPPATPVPPPDEREGEPD